MESKTRAFLPGIVVGAVLMFVVVWVAGIPGVAPAEHGRYVVQHTEFGYLIRYDTRTGKTWTGQNGTWKEWRESDGKQVGGTNDEFGGVPVK